ncbi:hypothetical protein MMC15_006018 [Xylographa vitiligo]|nr:hypothetical protein [Xylographa vitiligo]
MISRAYEAFRRDIVFVDPEDGSASRTKVSSRAVWNVAFVAYVLRQVRADNLDNDVVNGNINDSDFSTLLTTIFSQEYDILVLPPSPTLRKMQYKFDFKSTGELYGKS